MKKFLSVITALATLTLCACSGKGAEPKIIQNKDGSISITRPDEDGKAIIYGKKYDNFEKVTVVNLEQTTKNNPISISLAEYEGKDAYIEFNADMKIVNSAEEKQEIIWMINEVDENMPQIYHESIATNEWTNVSGAVYLHLGKNRSFYLSGAGLNKEGSTVYLKNFRLTLSGDGIGNVKFEKKNWLETPSLKETYKGIFDYFGLACTFNEELSKPEVQEGLKYQVDYITMGNEFKPDFIFNWQTPRQFVDFTGENGKTYKVPVRISYGRVNSCLLICRDNGLKMRGHVLLWHNQTPKWFFREDYKIDGDLVSADEMNARLEWYIKSVMEHVAEWEAENNNGEHIVKVWDVVNEACSDGVSDREWVRPANSSDWTAIYGDGSYIVNAFRYANKYAPADVELVYNDYGCSSPNKRKGIIKILKSIMDAPDARINAVGMQSHVGMDTKVTGPDSFESAIQDFVNLGLNVQITELDIGHGDKPYNALRMKIKYKEFFKVFIANRKTADKKGVEGVTLWGLNDEGTWLNALQEYKGHTQKPLLFETKEFIAKPAFYGVIEAAEQN